MSVTKWSETPPAPSRLAKVLVLLAAQFAGGLGRESIRLRQKNLSPERLQHRAPGFPRQRVVQRADALRRDDRDAAGLSGEGKKLLIAVGIVLPRGGEFVVLVADKKHLPPVAVGILFDLGNPVQHGTLEVEFHHAADGSGQAGVEAHREVDRANFSLLNEFAQRGQGSAIAAVSVELRDITLLGRTERAFHGRIVGE